MANDPQRAIDKYNIKAAAARVTAVTAPLVGAMKQNAAFVFEDMAQMETAVRQSCNSAGVSVIQYPFYLCFGREVWSRIRRGMAGESLAQEVAILIAKWTAVGLTQAVLQSIRTDVFNVGAPTP